MHPSNLNKIDDNGRLVSLLTLPIHGGFNECPLLYTYIFGSKLLTNLRCMVYNAYIIVDLTRNQILQSIPYPVRPGELSAGTHVN